VLLAAGIDRTGLLGSGSSERFLQACLDAFSSVSIPCPENRSEELPERESLWGSSAPRKAQTGHDSLSSGNSAPQT